MVVKKNKWERSDDYRSIFLKHNKGIFNKFYFCVYCGRPITAKNMQVDHHLAVNYVKKNPLLKLYFSFRNGLANFFGGMFYGEKWKKYSGVNVVYNLVPACPKCNRAKSDKGGIWVIRGAVGGFFWKVTNFICKILALVFGNPFGPFIALAILGLLLYFTPLGEVLMSLFK